MAVTYPLTFPSVGIKDSSFRLVRSTALSTSPFSFAQQAYNWGGEMWQGEVTFIPTRGTDEASIRAFMAKLRGRFGTFLYGDPDFLALGVQGTNNGTPLVNGGSQTGNELVTDGWANSEVVLKAGDYIQLGSALTSRLYMVVDDVTSDGSGNATINIEPALRNSPADNATITTTDAKGLFRLSSSEVEWSSDYSSIKNITIPFMEALNGA